ncbi:hypothetical protein SAMN05660462_01318 [Proteiniborus ethanoligenes]|uniref:Uncharacterized protein n=1 Tax=Proteiniborus ethanoligenes TaxID=415015 RepID=A0A1H3P0X5_9FIRM|nr:hypothetical protein [Proteiniborus ethanoligenes]SDY94623.1 hypothetical protein SAMN05660462_01318 [Proteiniborus ethanoligenes]
MDLSFLDKKGTKEFKNILEFLMNPDLIENTSQKTKFGKIEYRKEVILNSFKHLTSKDRQSLIRNLRDELKTLEEIVNSFDEFKISEFKESIAAFLYDLMKSINDSTLKSRTFEVLYSNDCEYSLRIIMEAETQELKKQLYEICLHQDQERGYLYGLLSDVNSTSPGSIDTEKMLNEINTLQPYHSNSILELVLNNYKAKDDLIDTINRNIVLRDFNTLMTLAKNINLLSQYKFEVDKEELLLLTWMFDIKDEDRLKYEIMNKDLSSYSYEWLIYLSDNLLGTDTLRRKIGIKIVSYIAGDKNLSQDNTDKIADIIKNHMKNDKELKDDFFEVLVELKSMKGFYEIVDMIFEGELRLLRNKNVEKYIYDKLEQTKENKFIVRIDKSDEDLELDKDLNPKILVLFFRKKSLKENYLFLSMMRDSNNALYSIMMEYFIKIIKNKLDDDKKYIKLMLMFDYECEDKSVLMEIKDFGEKNQGIIKGAIEVIDPSLLEDHYAKEIEQALANKDNRYIIEVLKKIESLDIRRNCSLIIVEGLLRNDFYMLVDIWGNLSLDVISETKYKEEIFDMLARKEIELTKEVIDFLDMIRIEPITLYRNVILPEQKEYLMDMWHKSGDNGKIVSVIKEILLVEANCLQDLEDIFKISSCYGINNPGLVAIAKIKAYSLISISLLDISVEVEGAPDLLDKLVSKLELFSLVDKFVKDETFHQELDKRIVDYIIKKLMINTSENTIWEYYWDNINKELNARSSNSSREKMESFFSNLTNTKDRIEWFLDIIDTKTLPNEIYVEVIESLLILLNKYNRIILQSKQENDSVKKSTLKIIGTSISKPLSNIEKTIITRSSDVTSDTLIENIRKLRRSLKEVGIDTVEDIDNYGTKVSFNNKRHENNQPIGIDEGIVDSLGIRIDNENIMLSTLLNNLKIRGI